MQRSGRKGFTLIELLVVMGIIAILMGIVVSAAQAIKQSQKEKSIQIDLKQLKLAMGNYFSMWGRVPLITDPAKIPPGYGITDLYDHINGNQNAFMIDMMSYSDYWWIKRRGPLVENKNMNLTTDIPPLVLDLNDEPYILVLVDPAETVGTDYGRHIVTTVGPTKMKWFSLGEDEIDQKGLGDNDDIGVGGVGAETGG